MVISSRTPEGDHNRCPVCGHESRIEPSEPSRDAPCPDCGQLLWFAGTGSRRSADLGAMMRLLVEIRFGPTPLELRPALQDLAENGEMEVVLQRLLTARSLAEALAGE